MLRLKSELFPTGQCSEQVILSSRCHLEGCGIFRLNLEEVSRNWSLRGAPGPASSLFLTSSTVSGSAVHSHQRTASHTISAVI